jgi:putative ABC transport system permease protein
MLGGAAALLFFIACANVAGLLLARAMARRREFTVRLWLGASVPRLLRPLFLEASILAIAGAALGLAAARAVIALVPRFVATHEKLVLDRTALLGALVAAVGMALLLGAAPAVVAFRQARPRGRFRHGLVVAQVAMSVTLLLAGAVLLRSLYRLVSTSPGFSTVHALKFGLGLPEKRYDSDRKLIGFHQQLEGKLAALPGVVRAGAAMRLPLRGGSPGPGGSFQIAGANLPVPQRPRAWINVASSGYFAAMSIPIVEGRAFFWQDDRPGEHRVAVVNRAFARMYLRDRRPVGTVLDIRWISDLNPDGSRWEIVGVAGDTRQTALEHEPVPEIFLSMTQVGAEGAVYVVRAAGDDAALPQAIASVVSEQDPRLERVRLQPLAAVVDDSLESRATAIRLIGGFGALAVILTAIGIYGVVALRAVERKREMAIRSALGATAGGLRRMVLAHGLRLALLGTLLGVIGFAGAVQLIRGQLYGVSELDAPSMAVVVGGVLLMALLASVVPARRAGRAAPMEILREL